MQGSIQHKNLDQVAEAQSTEQESDSAVVGTLNQSTLAESFYAIVPSLSLLALGFLDSGFIPNVQSSGAIRCH